VSPLDQSTFLSTLIRIMVAVRGALRCAGFLDSWSANPRTAATLIVQQRTVAAPLIKEHHHVQSHTQSPRKPTTFPPTIPSIQKKLHEAADRALDHYLNPAARIKATPRIPSAMFVVNPELDTETRLAHACESLASANVMTMDLADHMEGASRNSLLGIAQILMLGELAVNRELDNLDSQDCAAS